MKRIRVLLVGRGAHGSADRLRAASPRVELVVVDDTAAAEEYLADVDAVIATQRVTAAYLSSRRLRWLHLTGAGIEGQAIPELRDAPFAITHKALASVAPMA